MPMSDRTPPPRPASYDKKVGLVLQGGGALGRYQAGVYEALASSHYQPGWVAGISIGAVLAAPDRPLAGGEQSAAALPSVLFGQPGFFAPRGPQDWFSPDRLVSFYDTAALRGTLERVVDFDRINDSREIRLSVGAVNVRTGVFSYFDSDKIAIRPEHVMASGALPPGFPPVEIDGELYWDGGLFSNTPLQYMVG